MTLVLRLLRPLSAAQALQQQEYTAVQLSGRWHKDKSQSDSMQEACDVVELKWVLRRALAILNTLEVQWHYTVFSKSSVSPPTATEGIAAGCKNHCFCCRLRTHQTTSEQS